MAADSMHGLSQHANLMCLSVYTNRKLSVTWNKFGIVGQLNKNVEQKLYC